ncbi:RmlC-like jelly roll fold [Phytophthora cactorum]|nr:RmlC-like jelly roll fold [Phytophthora cactorum]
MSAFKTRAHVHRSIGSPVLYNFDPFLILDEFNVGLPGGFPDHPHRGFETVTYVLPTSKGGMRHEDFMENKGELRPGDLQWMTPGRGIMHAEMPTSTEPAHGLQLWVNLPKERKMIKHDTKRDGQMADTNVVAHEAVAMEKEGDGVLLTAVQDDNLEVVVVTGEL